MPFWRPKAARALRTRRPWSLTCANNRLGLVPAITDRSQAVIRLKWSARRLTKTSGHAAHCSAGVFIASSPGKNIVFRVWLIQQGLSRLAECACAKRHGAKSQRPRYDPGVRNVLSRFRSFFFFAGGKLAKFKHVQQDRAGLIASVIPSER